MSPPPGASRRRLPGSPFNVHGPVPEEVFLEVSDRVLHDRYGMGLVVGVEDATVRVDFGTSGLRRVPKAKLSKL